MPVYRICMVEDDEKLNELLSGQLRRFGYDVISVHDFEQVDREVLASGAHLVLLDINLPQFDGFYWCRRIRLESKAPILFISARSGDMDQVFALESGGDDYLTKPFHPEVLLAKVRALLRRAYGEYAPEDNAHVDALEHQGLALDPHRHVARHGEGTVALSATEAGLLRLLLQAQGRVVSREEMLAAIWDDEQFVDDNTLSVNMARVRRRLEELGLPDAVLTVRGQGYRLELEGSA